MKHLKKYENDDFDTQFDWEYFKNYVDTYNPQTHGADNWNIILLDMLYGLGISIDKKEFSNGDGFKKFKEYLKTEVHWKIKKDAKKYNL